jgi:hypothetical protein
MLPRLENWKLQDLIENLQELLYTQTLISFDKKKLIEKLNPAGVYISNSGLLKYKSKLALR